MKRTVTLAGTMTLAVALSGCALVDRWTGREAAPMLADSPGQIEPVHAAAIVQDQAVFWVSSNGCTQKADLLPVVRRQGDASVITLRRLKEDRCLEPRAQGVEMSWTFQEMGLAPGSRVSVENPYQLPRG
ncbi:MAG: hypothetical protein QME55_03425 [Brevundimonas sp.]|uniref:hypothetical protein n=1 Tax=Brevundimonas sp. TaxID=1871086 RepID=UPI002602A749|nr:hypothetical protein [Brevundimonas sp.]MDI6623756.1 hypothetical protein [Brevundimonas sp.]MDQ7812938.1 hypothetical protein [Brevundimonas sp.]